MYLHIYLKQLCTKDWKKRGQHLNSESMKPNHHRWTSWGYDLPCRPPPDSWGIQQAGWQPQGSDSRSWSPAHLSARGARRTPLGAEEEAQIASWEPDASSHSEHTEYISVFRDATVDQRYLESQPGLSFWCWPCCCCHSWHGGRWRADGASRGAGLVAQS